MKYINDVPEWAIERALALREEASGKTSIQAFACYIAEHEDPPADPLQEVVEEVMETVFSKMGVASWNAKAFAVELRKRGVTVVTDLQTKIAHLISLYDNDGNNRAGWSAFSSDPNDRSEVDAMCAAIEALRPFIKEPRNENS